MDPHAPATPVDGAEEEATPTRRRPRRTTWGLFAVVAVALYAVDQVTKALAVERLTGRPDAQLVGDLLQLRLVYNPGAAFSLGTGATPVLTTIAILAALVVAWMSRRLGSLGWALGLGSLMAGVAGNLTDRLVRDPGVFHGHVVDFLMLPNWPIFNVADMCINVAAVLIVVQAVRGVRLDGTREDDARPDDPDDEPGDDTDDTDDARPEVSR